MNFKFEIRPRIVYSNHELLLAFGMHYKLINIKKKKRLDSRSQVFIYYISN